MPKSKVKVKISFLLILILLQACAGVKPLPGWVTKQSSPKYPDSFYLKGIGISEGGFDQADAAARVDLAKQIKVEIKSEDLDLVVESREESGELSQRKGSSVSKSEVKTLVNLSLEGVTIKEHWHDEERKRYYALAVLERSLAGESLRKDIAGVEQAINKIHQEVISLEQKKDYLTSLQRYLDIYEKLEEIEPLKKTLRVINGSEEKEPNTAISLAEASGDIERMASGFRLRAVTGLRQDGLYGRPLKEELRVKVIYKSNGEELPVAGLPLTFILSKGEAELNGQRVSDDQGMAGGKVYQARASGEITVRFDLAGMVRNRKRWLESRHLNYLKEEKAVFNFAIPSITKKTLDKEEGVAELIAQVLSKMEETENPPRLGILDFVNIRNEKRGETGKLIEAEVKTELGLLLNPKLNILEFAPPEPDLTIVGKGKKIGADLVLTGIYHFEGDLLRINARLIDVHKGTIVSAGEILRKNLNTAEKETDGEGIGKNYELTAERVSNFSGGAKDFEIKIWTDKNEYMINEPVIFYFQAEEDCYLTLIDIGTSGKLTQLFPNQFSSGNFIRKGKIYSIPEPGAGFSITTQGPAGLERIKAVASTHPLNLIKDADLSGGFFQIKTEDKSRTRDLTVTLNKIKEDHIAEALHEIMINAENTKRIGMRGIIRQSDPKPPEKPIDLKSPLR